MRLPCEYAPNRVNEKDQVLLLKAYSMLCLVWSTVCWHKQGGSNTALHLAASKNSLDIAELLLSAGSAVDAEGNVSIHWAWLGVVDLWC